MLTQDQIDIISDAIAPLFQYLEHEVIADIARRIKKTMTYTRTAELMAMDMQRLGYSPARIRAEALKLLNADDDYKKEVEKNTLEYKREVKKLIDNITKAAADAGNDLIANAGNMSWIDDMSVWESAGKQLVEGSFLNQLVDAVGNQTADQMKNLTNATGFKSMHGYESIQNAYRHELDKAVIKLCSGTFSQEKVLNDVIHDLAHSGLRSIDFANGYSMQIDTAAKLAVRTGCHQISAKIHDASIEQTGENLVYVSKHWGARNKGSGVENHELWQGKVYYIKQGKDYTEEAKRIGQDRIMDIWYSTGYSPDGSHENNPLGLHGYNCRHMHYVFFEGISNIPKEKPQPGPFMVNGKEYDYYAMTQKLRSMERNIRALKREKEALEKLGMSSTDVNVKIKRKTREYKEFCEKVGVPKSTSNLRVESGSSDLIKTVSYQKENKLVRSKNRGIIDSRNMANGMRQSPFAVLDDEKIRKIRQFANELEIPLEILSFNTGMQTGFVDGKNIIHIRGDIFPDNSSLNNRDLLSEKAVLAHEYYGHYMHDPSQFRIGDWRDEFRASYSAAINAPGLTELERRMLMLDAYDRAKEAGVTVKYNQKARRIIYGYDE